MIPRLADSRPLVAIELVADIALNQPLLAGPGEESIEAAENEMALSVRPGHGFNHEAHHARVDRWESERFGFHQPDGLAGIVN